MPKDVVAHTSFKTATPVATWCTGSATYVQMIVLPLPLPPPPSLLSLLHQLTIADPFTSGRTFWDGLEQIF